MDQLKLLEQAIGNEGYVIDYVLGPLQMSLPNREIIGVELAKLQHVVSSNIESIAYIGRTSNLFVKFLGGKVYKYEEVSLEEATSLMEAESKGSYFCKAIKPIKKCTVCE